MSTLKEIETTLKYSGALNGYPVILMLCVSRYPTPPEDVNIKRLNYLKSKYPKITLGFSDHTEGFTAASLAVAYGATFFEKHFTLNKLDSGPDHWFSEDKKSLGKWVQTIKDSFTMLGKSKNFPIESEKKMRLLARKSIVAIDDIKKTGSEIILSNTYHLMIRPGVAPIKYMQILGLKSKIFIRKNRQIELNLLKK